VLLCILSFVCILSVVAVLSGPFLYRPIVTVDIRRKQGPRAKPSWCKRYESPTLPSSKCSDAHTAAIARNITVAVNHPDLPHPTRTGLKPSHLRQSTRQVWSALRLIAFADPRHAETAIIAQTLCTSARETLALRSLAALLSARPTRQMDGGIRPTSPVSPLAGPLMANCRPMAWPRFLPGQT
jgi:hypothetical protein